MLHQEARRRGLDRARQVVFICRSRWCHEMKQTSPAALVAECRSQLAGHPEWSKTKREAMELQLNYLESHSTRTHYGEYQAKGWFIGSGVFEAGCKTVVGRRLKQSGMFWGEVGAEIFSACAALSWAPTSMRRGKSAGTSLQGSRPRPGDGRPTRRSAPPDFFVLHPICSPAEKSTCESTTAPAALPATP